MAKNRPDENNLMDLVTHQHFAQIETVFRRNFKFSLETTGLNGNSVRRMCSGDCHPLFCRMVRQSATGAKRCRQDRLRGLKIAFETGQPYMSLCHAGIVLVCVPIMERETPLGGLFFGKCLWEPMNKMTEEDILKRLKGLRINMHKLIKAAGELEVVTGRKTYEAAEFLFICLYEITKLNPQVIKWRKQRTEQQSDIGEFIQQGKKFGIDNQYPYQSERQLIGKVKIGDRTGAREILNSLLGAIMLQSPGDLSVLKARLIELLSILSRAAVEGGADINLLLEKNLDYIHKVMDLGTQENICAWISSALNDFIECVYTSQDAGKMTKIAPAIEFIESNYDHPITIADIAKAAHLSTSRLAHLFKEVMATTLIDYLTEIRISHAKRLLLSTDESCTSICYYVGYNNQSYFTRIFKELVGMTPMRFKEANRRTQTSKPPE